MPTSRIRACAILVAAAGAWPSPSHALIITSGYSPAIDDRFVSGYPSAPVANTSPLFLAAGDDLSGVGWNFYDATQSAGAISPKHILESSHYPMGSPIVFLPANTTTPINVTVISAAGLSGVDLQVGTLGTALPSNVQVYSILDTGAAGNYNNQPLLLYGRGEGGATSSPRIGRNFVVGTLTGSGYNQVYISTAAGSTPNMGEPESGDSESPVFIPWTNPVSNQPQLTIIGAQWTTAYSSFLGDPGRYELMNALMTPTGYALLWTPSSIGSTWVGGTSNNWNTAANWSAGIPASGAYICFDPTATPAATSRNVNLVADRTVAGIYFRSGTAGRPFTLSAGSVINLGRGGIVNYDSAGETINSTLNFTDQQNWFAGAGGLTVTGTLFNNGNLLYFNTAGNSVLSGLLSGQGGLAKDGAGTLTISASQIFTGPVFAHAGVLNVAYQTGLSTSAVSIDPGATVRYSQVSTQAASLSSVFISAGGTLDIDSTLVMSGTTTSTRDALFASLKTNVIAGRNNGAWNGTGITSSLARTQDLAAGKELYGVAIVQNIDLPDPYDSATRPFNGLNVTSLSILIKYTYMGDVDLDGRITADDYLAMDIGVLRHKTASWGDGDFNYDGTVDYKDYALIDAANFFQAGTLADKMISQHAAELGQPYIDALTALGAIPEPGSLALLALGASAWVGARGRRRVGRRCVTHGIH